MCISVYNIGNNGTLDKVSMVTKTGAILSVYQCVMTRSEPSVKCCISVLLSYGVSTFDINGYIIWFNKHVKMSEGVTTSRKSKDNGKTKPNRIQHVPQTTTYKFDLKKTEQRERTKNREWLDMLPE